MDKNISEDFFRAQAMKTVEPTPIKKKKCGCKKGITPFDVIQAALAAYGLWKLGFSSYELISSFFQKERVQG